MNLIGSRISAFEAAKFKELTKKNNSSNISFNKSQNDFTTVNSSLTIPYFYSKQTTTTTSSQYFSNIINSKDIDKAYKSIISFKGFEGSIIKPGMNFNPTTKKIDLGVYSSNATRIELCIFDAPFGKEIKRIPLESKDSNDIWSKSIEIEDLQKLGIDLQKGKPLYYGLRAWGPNWKYVDNWQPGSKIGLETYTKDNKPFEMYVDEAGNRFNPNKLLTDPYSKIISSDPKGALKTYLETGLINKEKYDQLYKKYAVKSINKDKPDDSTINGSIYATGPQFGNIDSGEISPKSIFVLPEFLNAKTNPSFNKPFRDIRNEIVYEVNLRGLTMLDDSIPEDKRGTYAGAAMKAKYLKKLGITAIQFLPVQEFGNDQNDEFPAKNGFSNYWGYQTLNYFAPDRRYSSDKSPSGPIKEFKNMVSAFHNEGIKVYMDVVYNHTGEGGVWEVDSPNGGKQKLVDTADMYSLRGLDNISYYLINHNGSAYCDDTGCGASTNPANRGMKNLILDSLKYWRDEMGIDGFRFDLAPVLGNSIEKNGFHFDEQNENLFVNRAVSEISPRGIDVAVIKDISEELGIKYGADPQEWFEKSKKDLRIRVIKSPHNSDMDKLEANDELSILSKKYGRIQINVGFLDGLDGKDDKIINRNEVVLVSVNNEFQINGNKSEWETLLKNNKEAITLSDSNGNPADKETINEGDILTINSKKFGKLNITVGQDDKIDAKDDHIHYNGADIIAEPWDTIHQCQGRFITGWSEWNDSFRDTFRKYLNKLGIADITPGKISGRLSGSSDIFGKKTQVNDKLVDKGHPYKSVNFINAHDGFTLRDLVSYNKPTQNTAVEGGTQGEDNISWDQGKNAEAQKQAIRNAFTILMTSAGVPMFVGGDEILRTTNGHNNPYFIDDKMNYLNWSNTSTSPIENYKEDLQKFVINIIQFRKSHPALNPATYFNGKDNNNNGVKDIEWYKDNGNEIGYNSDYWEGAHNHFLGFRVDETELLADRAYINDKTSSSVYVGFNKGSGNIPVILPPNIPGKKWYLACDTSASKENDGNFYQEGSEPALAYKYGKAFKEILPRSIFIAVEK